MSADWPEFSIEELKASSRNAIAMGPFGSNIKAENFVKVGVPIIKGGNLTGNFIIEDKFDFLTEEKADELKASNAFRRDIVITHRGTIGQVGIIPDNSKFERYVVSQSQLKVTLDQEKVNPYFVYYFLRSPVGQHRLLMNASQVGVPAIAKASTSVKAIMVSCPEKEIQDKIVKIILDLDHKIHNNRQINQILESMAQTIFKSWFVDFEPVKAKIAAIEAGEDAEGVTRAAMRAISGKTDDELDKMQARQPENYARLKTTAELFPEAMQETELGEVPEGWGVKKIIHFGSIVCGKTPPTGNPENYGGDIPFVKIPDMHGNVFVSNTTEYLSVIGEKTQIKKHIPKGSVCISCIATVGLVSIAANACHTNQQINSIVPKDIILTPYLYFSMIERNKLLHDLASGGSTTLNLNTGNFAKIELLSPRSELLKEFYKKVNPIFEMLLSSDYQVQQLSQLRDALLPKLMSGEISISTNSNSNNENK